MTLNHEDLEQQFSTIHCLTDEDPVLNLVLSSWETEQKDVHKARLAVRMTSYADFVTLGALLPNGSTNLYITLGHRQAGDIGLATICVYKTKDQWDVISPLNWETILHVAYARMASITVVTKEPSIPTENISGYIIKNKVATPIPVGSLFTAYHTNVDTGELQTPISQYTYSTAPDLVSSKNIYLQ